MDELDGYGSKSNWRIQFKLDKPLHDLVEECANRYMHGNISGMMKRIVVEWIQSVLPTYKQDDLDVPVDIQFLRYRRAHEEQDVRTAELRLTWLELQRRPDPELEESARRMSEKYGLPWPPEDVRESEVDPDFSQIMDMLRYLWRTTPLVAQRDLQRNLGKRYSAKQLRYFLHRLEELGEVRLRVPEASKRTLLISPPTR